MDSLLPDPPRRLQHEVEMGSGLPVAYWSTGDAPLHLASGTINRRVRRKREMHRSGPSRMLCDGKESRDSSPLA